MLAGGRVGQGKVDSLETAGKIAHEATANIRTVQAFNMNKDVSKRYSVCVVEHERYGKRSAIAASLAFGFSQFVLYAAFALAFWYGGKLIADGELTFNDVMISSMAIMIGASQTGRGGAFETQYKDARESARKVFGLIDRKPSMNIMLNTAPADDTLRTGAVDIRFENVYFAYPSRPVAPVLRDFTLTIPHQKHVALMGSTGCGKSTVMQLLMRFYDPSIPVELEGKVSAAGSVKLNETRLQDVSVAWWRGQFAIVSQEPALFEGTIKENITYGLGVVSDGDVEQAAKLANLYGDVMQMPEKFATQVGTRGSKLSGGQKQRVAIARAIIRKPRVLLLDEATSALDNRSEAEVQRAIDKIIETLGMTVVTIAHRMTTIEGADQIAVLDGGALLELGDHAALMARNGEYADRYRQYHAQSSEVNTPAP
jgi:ATP-binding cassette subfamily B (MDR/TAP) protein 1